MTSVLDSLSKLYFDNKLYKVAEVTSKYKKGPEQQNAINAIISQIGEKIHTNKDEIIREIIKNTYKAIKKQDNGAKMLQNINSILKETLKINKENQEIQNEIDEICNKCVNLYEEYSNCYNTIKNYCDLLKKNVNDKSVMKEADLWIRGNIKYFYLKQMKQYFGEVGILCLQDKLWELHDLVKSGTDTSDSLPATKLIYRITNLINRILAPRNLLDKTPSVLRSEFYEYLSSRGYEGQNAVKAILADIDQTAKKSGQLPNFQPLANWINAGKVPLFSLYPLIKKEDIFKLAPLLESINLDASYYVPERWTEEEITKLIQIPSKLVYLSLQRTEVSLALPSNLNHLKHLDISGTNIKSIPDLPKIEYLNFENTQIAELPKLASDLRTLICSGSKVRSLPKGCLDLEHLELSRTKIGEIGAYSKLRTLICSDSRVESLPKDCLDLEHLEFSKTKIRELGVYSKLRTLICSDTPIDTLSIGPQLVVLDCSRTKVSELPSECPQLQLLYCKETNVKKLPKSEEMRVLDYSFTDVLELPTYPKLKELYLSTMPEDHFTRSKPYGVHLARNRSEYFDDEPVVDPGTYLKSVRV